MSVNPYPVLPRDKGGETMQEFPSTASVLAVYASENASASSVITLTPDTTILEIATIGVSPTGAVMRYVRTADTQGSVISAAGTANFKHVIGNNTVRRFAVPIEGTYQAPSSMVGANIQNGLYRRVAIKSLGVASVLFTEY